MAALISVCVHITLQPLPAMPSTVHGLPSLQLSCVGQRPSQRSPGSTMRLPHIAWQSRSLLALAPGGQHWSPLNGSSVGTLEHARLQFFALPVKISKLHGFASSQLVGQACV